jgi:hypothetical protein
VEAAGVDHLLTQLIQQADQVQQIKVMQVAVMVITEPRHILPAAVAALDQLELQQLQELLQVMVEVELQQALREAL